MKKIAMNMLKYAAWFGFALYTALMIYGLYTIGFKIMEPWLKVEAGFICLIFTFKAMAINKETEVILDSLK